MTASIRQMGVITAHLIRKVAFNPAVVWLIAMPLVIIYILGITMHGLFSAEFTPVEPYRIVVAHPEKAGFLVERLSRAPKHFAVEEAKGAHEARQAVFQRQADAAIVAADGDEPLTVIAPPGSIVLEMLAGVVQASLEQEAQQVAAAQPPVENGSREESDTGARSAGAADGALSAMPWEGVGSFEYFSIGLIVMFMAFASHSAMVHCVQDRSTGAYLRIRALGVTRAAYLGAGITSGVLLGAGFSLVMAVITWMLFRVTWGNAAAWALLTIAGAASIASLSFLLTALLPSDPKGVENAGGTVYSLLAFFGGSTVPLTIMPRWFSEIFSWLPNRKMLDGYLKIVKGAGVKEIEQELFGLAAAALIMLGLAWLVVMLLKREEV